MLWIFIPYTVMESGYTVMASLLPIREHIDHLTVGVLIDHIFLHPMGPYWYLHTLMLCGICYYLAFMKLEGRLSSVWKQEKPLLPIKMLSLDNQVLLGRFTLLALFLWLLSYACGLLSIANAAYFLVGTIVRQAVGNFRLAFPARWWTIGLLVVWCIDPIHYDKASFAGACLVFLVIGSLLWLYQLGIPQPLRDLFLFIGRNTLPLLLFSPIFTILDSEASPKAISERTSYLQVRLEFLRYPHLIQALFNVPWFGPPVRLTALEDRTRAR